MNKVGKSNFLLVMSVSALASTICIGYGNWIIGAFKEREETIKTTPSVPICYIQGNKDVKYMSIEKALEVAGDEKHINTSETIVIIPGSMPVISDSCTITSNDTLIIPYENETYMRDLSKITSSDVNSVCSANYSDYDLNSVQKFKKTEVVVNGKNENNEKITLVNNGKIIIGGELGVGDGNQRPSGHTNGKYSQITLEDDATIENNGSIEIYGYIKKDKENGTGKLTCNSSGSISMPLVINDFKGGSYSSACNSQNVFPFNVFELINCQCETEFYAGSDLSVMTAIYANDKIYVPEKSKLISKSGALFNVTTGKAVLNYDSYSFPYTKIDNAEGQNPQEINKMQIQLDGSVSFNSMSLSLGSMSLNTGDFNVPISYKFSISCLKGSDVKIQKPTKFLSGSSVIINDGASFTFESSSIFYQTYVDQTTYVSGKYPKKLGPAVLVNDGNLKINSSFAGKILTNDSSGNITTGSGFSASFSTDEVITTQSGGMSWTYRTVSGKAFGNIKTSETEMYSEKQFISNSSYNANNGARIGQASSSDVSETISSDKSGKCVPYSSLVLMADGSYKMAGEVRTGDMVMSFNHETGKVEANLVIGNDDIDNETMVYDVVHLVFSNNKTTDFVDEHGYFDLTLNKYVYLHIDDYEKYIGHEFVSFDSNHKISKVILLDGIVNQMFTKIASPATAMHLDLIVDDFLSIGGGLNGLFNIFDYDPSTLAFDKEKMEKYVNEFGLLNYKYFEKFFPEEIYNLLPCKYLAVSIGKKMITWNIFESYVNKWKDQLMENI